MNSRILLVEDEPGLVLTVSDLLMNEGYDVDTAMDGEAGLLKATSEPYDLIILDVMMPKRNGYEVCQRMRERPDWRGIKIIMLSAKGRDVEVSKGVSLGADLYVTKPFSNAELVAQIYALLAVP